MVNLFLLPENSLLFSRDYFNPNLFCLNLWANAAIHPNMRNFFFFFQISKRKWSMISFCFLKSFTWGKSKWFAPFDRTQLGNTIKANRIKLWILYPEICSIFIFLKDLVLVPPPHFMYDFLTTMFLMLYSINWPNFTFWLRSLLEILGNIFCN